MSTVQQEGGRKGEYVAVKTENKMSYDSLHKEIMKINYS